MDSFNFRDVKLGKPNSILNHPSIPRLMTLFRFVELLLFLIFLSRFTTQFSVSFNLSAELFRGVSVTLTSPRYVFIVGNAIVITLFLISRSLSGKNDEDYTDKCEKNKSLCIDKEKKVRDLISGGRTCRSYSENMDKWRRELRCRGIKGGGRCSDDMNGEEFRQTVEAFIARQQRILRRK